jgi:hypothetical protein
MTERSGGLGAFADEWLHTGDVAKRAKNPRQVKLTPKGEERGGEAKTL